MPIYEYHCTKCDTIKQLLQHISAKTSLPCSDCGSTMKRIISKIGGFKFIGPGFYETDYKNKN